MRAALLLAAVIPALACGQTDWHTGFGRALKAALDQQQQLPPKREGAGEQFRLLSAAQASVSGDEVTASGGVHASYKGYDIFADTLTGNRKTQVFRLEGNGRIVGETEAVEGQIVIVDFKNNSFSFQDGQARLGPGRLQKYTTGDVFFKARDGFGKPGDFITDKGQATTCDLSKAHYELNYDTARVIPGRRAELRGVSLEILGKTVLKLPMIVIPLNRQAPKYLPQVGQSVDEGYFVKSRITTPLPGENYVDTLVDLMTKMGVGMGLDYNYKNSWLDGRLTGYTVTGGSRSRVFTAQQQSKVGKGSLALNAAYQISNYLTAPSTTLFNTNALLQMPWGGGSSRLSFNRSSSSSFGFDSSNQSVALGDDRLLAGVSSRIDMSLTSADTSGSGYSTRSQQLDVRYNASAPFRSFTADLVYQRSIPVGQAENFYSASDITPLLSLKSSSSQIFGPSFSSHWPLSFEASVGEMLNPSSTDSTRVTRIFFDVGLHKSENLGKKWSAGWGSEYRQGLYSDDTAQYVLAHDANLSYNFRKDSSIGVSYNSLRSFGFTPLAIDSTGRGDAFGLNLGYKPSKAFALTATSGYDVLQGSLGQVPWQNVWIRTKYQPGDWLSLNTSASYDTYNHAWGNFRLDGGMTLGDTQVTLGARYDGLRSKWAGLNLLVDGFRLGRLSTSFLLDYNGYTQQMDSQHYQFVYDLHCAEAVFEVIDNQLGFRSGRTFAFFIRVKALPFGSDFGYGTGGQRIGGGLGGSGF